MCLLGWIVCVDAYESQNRLHGSPACSSEGALQAAFAARGSVAKHRVPAPTQPL